MGYRRVRAAPGGTSRCPHGRPVWCSRRHHADDRQLGQPLCWECYDYVGHVLWQWHAPELWRRFTIALQQRLAADVGLSVKAFRNRCRIPGVRIGEALAVLWSEVDLDVGTVRITSTLIRVRGEGLLRKRARSRAGEQTLPLPASACQCCAAGS